MRKFTSVPALIGFQILGHSICACVAAGGYLALVMPDVWIF
jgi:hypothetical protein